MISVLDCPEEDCGYRLVLITEGKKRGIHQCPNCGYEQ